MLVVGVLMTMHEITASLMSQLFGEPIASFEDTDSRFLRDKTAHAAPLDGIAIAACFI
ncbi:hypothetical protein [Brucella pseudogrignonensis]|uniref:hypothetical protein n=1 Tax=Brucella pseudogrignonensis TaxID=419475 RepID=UPI000AACA6E0|nr:hypothetical protein [Brucella pseudogrignonensis]